MNCSREYLSGEISGWRRILAPLLLTIASLAFSSAAAEFSLRLAGFSYQLRAVVVESTGPEPEVLYRHYNIDPDFIWVPNDYYDNLATALRTKPEILFLGDSCTEFSSYDRYLVSLINQGPSPPPVRSGKLAVAGWSSQQGLQQVKRDVVRVMPRVATIYFGWNDHWNSIGITDREVTELIASPIFRHQSLRLVQLLTKAYVGLKGRAQDQPAARVPPEDFRWNISEMADAVRGYGGTPVLLTAPSSHKKGREPAYLAERWLNDLRTLVPIHRQYAGIVREVAKEKDVVLCDLAARFDQLGLSEGEARTLFKSDGIHLLPRGSRIAARFLMECFRDHGLDEVLTKAAGAADGRSD